MRSIQHWIGGVPVGGSTSAAVHDPATGLQSGEVVLGRRAEVDLAVGTAARAFESWSEVSLSRRARIMFALRDLLERHEDELARLVTAEHGKVLDDARGEVVRGREVVEFACGIAQVLKGEYSDQVSSGVDAFSFRQPLGVCAGVVPFNFPVMVPLWMHPIAIACGNTFVLKPSERVPSASNLVAELYAQAGLPDGVFNVLHGDRETADALITHPGVAAVSFVGSTPVARHVHEAAGSAGKRVQALGGAKNHAVVLPDADLDLAADQITAAAYGSAGQRCMAVSVAVAVGAAADPLIERLAVRARAIKVGPGADPASEMGPLISEAARERVTGHVGDAERAGAKLVVDGRGAAGPGFFVGPCLLDGVATEMAAYQEEIFGPVLLVLRAETLDEAIELINANPYGNGTAIFTSSGEAARRFQRAVHVGMIGVNVPIPVPMAFYSFGGWKASLFGDTHIHGAEGVRFYTRAKAVTSRWPAPVAADGASSMAFPTAQ
ncbi:malonate-semialdehyde dehydrogenase (acetylating)/methylmalonate-semialdehyde dehydrogenase [Actinomadura coerulea]|uniref:methylmalonate-semialdehyde dehydrogenase (CoA acylating) n=1 Tax=Actinomadura coerulea TaxID=46159 RepID=A0A7X0KYJ1_9ACTN|nr:CoA-acylating methylmalonate-semialdehyde dehydrogenase [Actinomadura coerulea]MBB6395460.1 malonate-semialdehyde dehydrogenase (acetylating)/methylmalonate-semialdehyde dehydrogenase [Actinomadura coerulea]GGQ47357.1 methylmalonate-semialdehyde dehydrogenase (acylating) [Actinomadura coerulea]